jgi:hypothetical protein
MRCLAQTTLTIHKMTRRPACSRGSALGQGRASRAQGMVAWNPHGGMVARPARSAA